MMMSIEEVVFSVVTDYQENIGIEGYTFTTHWLGWLD